MIGISRLYLGKGESSDPLRYARDVSTDTKPVVVWNATRRCNLRCAHCYSDSENVPYTGELDTAEAKALIDDLSKLAVPVLLFSGGEPLLREDIFELAAYASSKGIRPVLSTNGTLISSNNARKLKEGSFAYVGVSLDGVGSANDEFRGVSGAFERALSGIRNCRREGLKVGLRFTISKKNASEVSEILRLVEREAIERVCFYHLVLVGRGASMRDEYLPPADIRRTLDLIIDFAREMQEKGLAKEILTVDNHADGVYLYLRMKKEGSPRSEEVLELLRRAGGNRSGSGIACIDWLGNVYPDQFWRTRRLGNVRERRFSKIWRDPEDPVVAKLRSNRRAHLKGRCSRCSYFELCCGNLRARAEAATGDPWASDPACYLTDEEIGLNLS